MLRSSFPTTLGAQWRLVLLRQFLLEFGPTLLSLRIGALAVGESVAVQPFGGRLLKVFAAGYLRDYQRRLQGFRTWFATLIDQMVTVEIISYRTEYRWPEMLER
jgi:hypothetical protein